MLCKYNLVIHLLITIMFHSIHTPIPFIALYMQVNMGMYVIEHE